MSSENTIQHWKKVQTFHIKSESESLNCGIRHSREVALITRTNARSDGRTTNIKATEEYVLLCHAPCPRLLQLGSPACFCAGQNHSELTTKHLHVYR